MYKSIFILLALSIFAHGCQIELFKKEVDYDIERGHFKGNINRTGEILYYKDKPFTGITTHAVDREGFDTVVDYFWGETVYALPVSTIKNLKSLSFPRKIKTGWNEGIKDGQRQLYADGLLVMESNWLYGKIEGPFSTWYENGQQMSEGNLKADRLDGLYRSWHENGQLESEKIYKDGNYDGLYREWYENGQLWIEDYYKDGKKDGLQQGWFWGGTTKYKVNYKDGQRVGYD